MRDFTLLVVISVAVVLTSIIWASIISLRPTKEKVDVSACIKGGSRIETIRKDNQYVKVVCVIDGNALEPIYQVSPTDISGQEPEFKTPE